MNLLAFKQPFQDTFPCRLATICNLITTQLVYSSTILLRLIARLSCLYSVVANTLAYTCVVLYQCRFTVTTRGGIQQKNMHCILLTLWLLRETHLALDIQRNYTKWAALLLRGPLIWWIAWMDLEGQGAPPKAADCTKLTHAEPPSQIHGYCPPKWG